MSTSLPEDATKFTLQEPLSGNSTMTCCLVSMAFCVALHTLGSKVKQAITFMIVLNKLIDLKRKYSNYFQTGKVISLKTFSLN